jgi:pSer/pThr/pTyr-binding forkhead associated (FHA) protein
MILPQRAEVMIGRSPLADFVVADQTVSSRHALLKHDGTTWMIHDAGSTNGTFLNGWRITDPVVVRPGDELTVGESTYVLVLPPA